MSTAIIPSEVILQRPSPEDLDRMVDEYLLAKGAADEAAKAAEDLEFNLMQLVAVYGVVPPHAESSRRLDGKLSELTVTTGNTITVDESRVQDLHEALKANKREDFFHKLFAQRIRHELVDGADTAIRAECMSQRLTDKILSLFGRCITAKKKKPSLKVRRIAQAKTKKSR